MEVAEMLLEQLVCTCFHWNTQTEREMASGTEMLVPGAGVVCDFRLCSLWVFVSSEPSS